jgi:hypothetical protein
VHRSNSSQSRARRLIIFTAVAGTMLGAIAAVPAHSLLSAQSPSVAVRAQHGATGEPDSAYYYFPSQFRSPDGPVAAIPPKNINLNFPETTAIKEAFTNPNDKGV